MKMVIKYILNMENLAFIKEELVLAERDLIFARDNEPSIFFATSDEDCEDIETLAFWEEGQRDFISELLTKINEIEMCSTFLLENKELNYNFED